MRFFLVNSFTDRPFSGNPAGVVLLDEPAADDWMQAIATEFGLSETAFAISSEDGRYGLRWFSPTVEVPLCGHATLATAAVLAREGVAGPYLFDTLSGELRATVDRDEITLDFPADPPGPAVDGPDLDIGAESWHEGRVGWIAVLPSPEAVTALAPDFEAIKAAGPHGLVVTAPGGDGDFVSRFFAPSIGINEDPATGIAHCALAPFWAQRLGRTDLTGVQLSARRGKVGVRLRGDRVELVGKAVVVGAGELLV